MSDINYTELAVASIQDKRNIVISSTNKSGYTMAQQVVVSERKRDTKMFLKHGFILDDLSALYNLRDALNVAIKKEEERKIEEKEWDN